MRNKQLDIMLAIGIVFVLMGHSHQPSFLFYPAYAFHMGLFFFISGFFFKPRNDLVGKAELIAKKIKTQLVPYALLLILFGVLTQILRHFGLNLGTEMNMDSLFYGTFARADQFHLYLSAWFLLTLFLVNVFAILVYRQEHQFNWGVQILAFIGLYFLLEMGRKDYGDWHLQLIRSGYGLFFFGLGYLFKVYEEYLRTLLLKPVVIVGLFLVVNLLNVNFGNISYSILLGNIGNEWLLVPIFSTICIILLIYIVAHFFSQITQDDSWVLVIGRSTFTIMVWHFVAFLLLNIIFFALGWVKLEQLSDVYFRYQVEKTWALYLLFGLTFPILLSKAFLKLKQAIREVDLSGAELADERK